MNNREENLSFVAAVIKIAELEGVSGVTNILLNGKDLKHWEQEMSSEIKDEYLVDMMNKDINVVSWES